MQTRRLMAIYGYARASTLEQNVTIQEDALRRAGCEVIRSEKVSGSSRAGRSELALLLQFLRHGDTLMVTRVDRLARSIKDLQDIVHELRAAGVTLRATEQPIDTSSAAGKAFLDMLGVFAEFEINLFPKPLILNVTFCHLSAGHFASMDSLRTDNLDVRHPITAEVILNVFDKRLLVPSQPLGIVA